MSAAERTMRPAHLSRLLRKQPKPMPMPPRCTRPQKSLSRRRAAHRWNWKRLCSLSPQTRGRATSWRLFPAERFHIKSCPNPQRTVLVKQRIEKVVRGEEASWALSGPAPTKAASGRPSRQDPCIVGIPTKRVVFPVTQADLNKDVGSRTERRRFYARRTKTSMPSWKRS